MRHPICSTPGPPSWTTLQVQGEQTVSNCDVQAPGRLNSSTHAQRTACRTSKSAGKPTRIGCAGGVSAQVPGAPAYLAAERSSPRIVGLGRGSGITCSTSYLLLAACSSRRVQERLLASLRQTLGRRANLPVGRRYRGAARAIDRSACAQMPLPCVLPHLPNRRAARRRPFAVWSWASHEKKLM
jgi:hypothetical protein